MVLKINFERDYAPKDSDYSGKSPEWKFILRLFGAINSHRVYSSYPNYLVRGGFFRKGDALVLGKPKSGGLLRRMPKDEALLQLHEFGDRSYAVLI